MQMTQPWFSITHKLVGIVQSWLVGSPWFTHIPLKMATSWWLIPQFSGTTAKKLWFYSISYYSILIHIVPYYDAMFIPD